MDETWMRLAIKHIDDLNISDADKDLFKRMAVACRAMSAKLEKYEAAIVRMDEIIEELKKTK